jgi:hypothetical protein
MTTDPDRRARIEFDAAAFVSYALRKEHTMREYCPHCHRELCPSEGRIFAGICIDCFLADKEPPPVAHEAPDYDPPCPYCDDHYEHACIDECPANPDTYDGPIPSEDHEPYGFNRYGIMVLAALVALALSLTTHTAHAAPYTPTAPVGCTVTGYAAQDDMSAIAVCAGGYLITKEDGPRDIWNDIPYSTSFLYLTDAHGIVHEVPKLD